jgi:hypothetical protein
MLLIIMIPTVLISLKTVHTSFITTHFLQAFQEFTGLLSVNQDM